MKRKIGRSRRDGWFIMKKSFEELPEGTVDGSSLDAVGVSN